MDWFFELSHGLRAAIVLAAASTLVLTFVARMGTSALTLIALVAPTVAAIPALVDPTGETLPVVLVLAAAFCCALLLRSDELADPRHRAECVALQMLGTGGACVLATATDWLSLLIGFEAMSLSVAVLAGIGRGHRSLEVAFRFFVLSAVAAATLVYGIALHWYATGSFAIAASALPGAGMGAMATAAIVLGVVGVAFELAVVPSHLGTLGVCFAAPLGCTTFAMTVSKVSAAFAMMHLAQLKPEVQPVLIALAIVTIAWSTFGGLGQRHLRGMLAYSAVGHGGFLALAAGCGAAAADTVAYYALVYVASVLLVLGALSGTHGDLPLADLGKQPMGRMRRFALVFGLLSLAGVPPTPGLFAKIAVLTQSWSAAGPTLTIVAALGGVFGALFYLRPVPDLLAGRHGEPGRGATPFAVRVAIAAAAAAFVLTMIVPQLAVRFGS